MKTDESKVSHKISDLYQIQENNLEKSIMLNSTNKKS